MNEITLILISYKSEKIIYNFIKKIPPKIKTIIVENSQNHELKKSIEQNYKNISVYIKENNGVSSALNFAVEKIETKYFLQISPDLEFNFEDLNIFLNFAETKEKKFAALGPRFLEVKEKNHKQINQDSQFGEIDSIHGSCMFINKDIFLDIGKFDENFFLYFEETEYCYRAKKKGYLSYQINDIKVITKGRSVDLKNEKKENFSNILIWHFIWSKFYFSKKRYGNLVSVIIFIPLLFRINFKITYHKILRNKTIVNKYKYRLDGLLKSIKGKNSTLRP
jgi:N-acetylglucosaminyl-diphospho-decaprenol L-rhamnosyltransferase